MADPEAPLPPLEIPWKLAATTLPLAVGDPAETALSLFFFEPNDEALIARFPDETLDLHQGDRVGLSGVVSTRAVGAWPRASSAKASRACTCCSICRVRNTTGDAGTTRPYFHAAAPLTRRIVQTGIVGAEAYEGEAEGMAIGKSGAQLNETLRSHSSTNNCERVGGIHQLSCRFRFCRASSRPAVRSGRTSTDVASDRNVGQSVDTTNRQASEERRELISHTTRVENVISLLSAKYVGTPHLVFSLSPQPLQQFSIDPTDPNLWFQQLLARRSSGIEGIQEFTAVILVPKGAGFCLNARLGASACSTARQDRSSSTNASTARCCSWRGW